MADEQTTTTDTSGVVRTTDGTIADQGTTQSSETKTQSTTTEAAKIESNDGKSVLNQKEAPKEGEAKTEEGKKEEAKAGVPDKYEYKLPEGYSLDPKTKDKADAVFKELGLPQEGAQKLVDMYRELTTEAFQAPYKAYQDTVAGWLKEAQDHPDLRGKLGPGQEVNVRIAKLIDGFPDQKLASDFREAMDISGIGNHPAFIRAFDYVAKQLTEGGHVAGNGPGPGGQNRPGADARPGAAATMWPNLPSASDRR